MVIVGDRRETGCERVRHSEHGRGHGVGDRGSLGVGEPNNELWLLVKVMTVADAAVAAAVPWQEASPASFTRHDRAIPHQS